MTSSKFNKPPLTSSEKEQKAEEFINFTLQNDHNLSFKNKTKRILQKEPVKHMALRFPKTLAEDITEISAITGLSINAVCIDLLRSTAKNKLKILKE
ncbi:hypothetical protein [Rickettsia conorii]|uniref:Uncharacterized protein n=1 Tax=Rickettsia conorii subsp. raoultii TaxID=369822 RepID=A0A9N7AW29_RICCR|nr:hypothetical protein [Rickettsia conorii]AJQ52545.1 hypothetical protein UQ52_08025 [Rickettsia conorii subsp. raoultii]